MGGAGGLIKFDPNDAFAVVPGIVCGTCCVPMACSGTCGGPAIACGCENGIRMACGLCIAACAGIGGLACNAGFGVAACMTGIGAACDACDIGADTSTVLMKLFILSRNEAVELWSTSFR